jgi:hypothetical protein
MKIYSITPRDSKGEIDGNTIYTADQNEAISALGKGHDVKMADAFFHPVAIQLNRVRGKGEKE